MENILRNTVFFLCACLSCTSFAEVEETFTYGTQTSTEPLSFDAWNHMVYGVFPGGAASQVAGSEYSNYRADFEKRKYCSANKSSIGFNYELCVNREMNNFADNVLKCPPETNVTTVVNPVVGSISASTSPNANCLTALRIDYDRKVSNCSRDTGHMMCKAYGGF